MGIINIADSGYSRVHNKKIKPKNKDDQYIGKGKLKIVFSNFNKGLPAKFIFYSSPSHQEYPTGLMKSAEALPTEMGSLSKIITRAAE